MRSLTVHFRLFSLHVVWKLGACYCWLTSLYQNNEELSAELQRLTAAAKAYHKAMQGKWIYSSGQGLVWCVLSTTLQVWHKLQDISTVYSALLETKLLISLAQYANWVSTFSLYVIISSWGSNLHTGDAMEDLVTGYEQTSKQYKGLVSSGAQILH